MTIPSITITSGDGISFTHVDDCNVTIATNGVLLDSDTTVTKQGNDFNGASQLVQLDANGKLPEIDGSNLTGVTSVSTIVQIGTCSTASATAAKEVTLSDFELETGATILVTFANANTAATPTLNVNSTGAKAIYNEAGTAVSSTNPAYFPAGATVEFTYDGTNWIFKKRIIENYVNNSSWYRIYSDGWIEQGGRASGTSPFAITFVKEFKNSNYNIQTSINATNTSASCGWTDITSTGFSLYSASGLNSWMTSGY